MHRFQVALLGLVLTASCARSADEGAPASKDTKVTTAAATAETPLSSRSQYDLAAAIRVIEKEQDDDERAFSLATLSDAWQGERYEWTVNFLTSFCPNENGCHVVPFDRGGKDKDIVQGWSPELKLSAEQWRELSDACSQSEGHCPVTFRGTLSKFRISTQELTRLTFTDVKLVALGDHGVL